MFPFDFQPRTRIVFGIDKIDMLGALAREFATSRVMLVTDHGLRAVGHPERATKSLESAGLTVQIFDDVHENPTTKDVDAGLIFAEEFRPEMIIGLGGGSSMDCAKGINFLFTNGGTMLDYWGVGKATEPMLPMIAVPTTAGTGSETQSFALISDAKTHVKMPCGDKKASFRVAVLDPTLTITQPHHVAAVTGIDAVAHAIESFVTTRRTSISESLSREAWLYLSENFDRILDEPNDLDARGGMQLGAALAGLAIENSMLGAAHALSNPLTANYGIVHGHAVGIMLPHVVRFNRVQAEDQYATLLDILPRRNGRPRSTSGAECVAGLVDRMLKRAGLTTRLADCGVERSLLEQLAAEAARQWTGKFNPRPVDEQILLEIYRHAF